jgi:hypothetical protein
MGVQLVMVPTRMFAGVWKEMQVMAVIRAVENRVSTVMLDGAYRTTMVDPYGRIVADQVTPEGGPLTLVADVPLGSPNALYTRLGDWIGWLSLAGWIGVMVFQWVTSRKKAGEIGSGAGSASAVGAEARRLPLGWLARTAVLYSRDIPPLIPHLFY